MEKHNTYKFILLLIIPLFFFGLITISCVDFEEVSPIPEIKFNKFTLSEGIDSLNNPVTAFLLEFDFIDGDADIGVEDLVFYDSTQADTARWNLWLHLFRKVEGEYIEQVKDTIIARIQYDQKMDRVGQNKTIKGTIFLNHQFQDLPDYDTTRYEFYLYDRALNKSNVETTPDFVFSSLGEYIK